MNRHDFNQCVTKVSLSDKQKQEMLDALLAGGEKTREKVKRPVQRRLSMAALATIAVLVITATTALAIHFGWHEKLFEYFNPTQEQISMMQPATDFPEVSISENGLTITIQQTLTDIRGIYVVYEIEITQDIEMPDDVQWWFCHLAVTSEEHLAGSDFSYPAMKILDMSDRKITVLFQPMPLTDGRAKMEFRDLICYNAEKHTNTVGGIWTLEWDFHSEGTASRIVPLQKWIDVQGGTLLAKEVIISPMSIRIILEGSLMGEDDIILMDSAYPLIHLEDGTTIDIRESIFENATAYGVSEGEDLDGTIEYHYRFDNLYDWMQIESIEIGDSIMPIEY